MLSTYNAIAITLITGVSCVLAAVHLLFYTSLDSVLSNIAPLRLVSRNFFLLSILILSLILFNVQLDQFDSVIAQLEFKVDGPSVGYAAETFIFIIISPSSSSLYHRASRVKIFVVPRRTCHLYNLNPAR